MGLRTTAAFLGLSLLAIASVGVAAEPSRPAGTGKGRADALILEAKGAVTVRPAQGKPFPGALSVPLLKSDELEAAAGAFAILKVTRNNCLARLDEELSLRISDLAVFDSAPCSASDDAQVRALLTESEFNEGKSRIVGYRAGLSAADTAGGGAAAQKAYSAKGASAPAPALREVPPPAAAPLAAPPAARRPAPAELDAPTLGLMSSEKKRGKADLSSVLREEAPARATAGSPSVHWRIASEGKSWRADPAPTFIAEAADKDELRQCLSAMLGASGSKSRGSVEVLVRVKQGRVELATLRGLLVPAGCAAHIGPEASGAPEGKWIAFEVRLP